MATGSIKAEKKIQQYVLHGNTNSFGNISIPESIVKPSTGVVLAVSSDQNYKAVILGQTSLDVWTARVYNYATTNMDSVTSTEVYLRIFYQLF